VGGASSIVSGLHPPSPLLPASLPPQRVRSRAINSDGRVLPAHSASTAPVPAALRYLRGLGGAAAVSAALYDPASAKAAPASRSLVSAGTGGATVLADASHNTGNADAAAAVLSKDDARCIDLFILLRVLMLEYREEQVRSHGELGDCASLSRRRTYV
jgi:hypothetical protein